jgi:hypothetical protein
MLEFTNFTGHKVYISPSHVVAVTPHSERDSVIHTVTMKFEVTGSAERVAKDVSAALAKNPDEPR